MSDINDALQTKALEPASVSVDGQSVSNRSISDLIAADKYQRANQALGSPLNVLSKLTVKLKPPGADGR